MLSALMIKNCIHVMQCGCNSHIRHDLLTNLALSQHGKRKYMKHKNNYIHPDNKKAIAFFKKMGIKLTKGELCTVEYDYSTDEPIRIYKDVLFVDINIGGRKFHQLLVNNNLLCGQSTVTAVDRSSVDNNKACNEW